MRPLADLLEDFDELRRSEQAEFQHDEADELVFLAAFTKLALGAKRGLDLRNGQESAPHGDLAELFASRVSPGVTHAGHCTRRRGRGQVCAKPWIVRRIAILDRRTDMRD